MILPVFLFLAADQPLQINLCFDNDPSALHRNSDGHAGNKSQLCQPAAFKVEGGRRVGPAILRNVSHSVVTFCFVCFINCGA